MDRNRVAHLIKKAILNVPVLHRALARYVIHPYNRHLLRRLADHLPIASYAGPTRTVLLLAFRPWSVSRAWELSLSRHLQASDVRVVWVQCDRAVDICDAMTRGAPAPSICADCVAFNVGVAQDANIETISLRDYVDPSPPVADLSHATRTTFHRLLGRRASGHPKKEEQHLRRCLNTAASRVSEAGHALLDAVHPDGIIALNGKFYMERLILDAAHSRGIPIWTYERGYRPNTLIFSHTPTAIPFDTTRIRSTIDQPLSPDEEATLSSYLDSRERSGPTFCEWQSDFGSSTSGRFTVAAFTNLIWDSSVTDEETVFDDMFDWLETLVSVYSSMPGVRLAIRVHPAESTVYWRPTNEPAAKTLRHLVGGRLPPNVAVYDHDDPVNTYDLLRATDLVLTYTTTVGLEAATLGKRVVVAARSVYSSTPFVETPPTRDEYLKAITRLDSSPPHPDTRQLARRFAYRLFFSESTEIPIVRESVTGFDLDLKQTDANSLATTAAGIADSLESGGTH